MHTKHETSDALQLAESDLCVERARRLIALGLNEVTALTQKLRIYENVAMDRMIDAVECADSDEDRGAAMDMQRPDRFEMR